MAEEPGKRPQYTVACRCGAQMTFDAASFGRARPCASCGMWVTVMWGLDPMGRERMPVVTIKPPPRAARPPGRSPETAFCRCENPVPVPPEEAECPSPCPLCGKLRVAGKAPGTKEIRRAAKPKKTRPAAPPAPPPAPKPALRVQVNHDAKSFECPCGKRIPVPGATTGKPVPCPACGRPHIVERLKAPPPAAPPAPPPAPKPALRVQVNHDAKSFECPCGKRIPVPGATTGKPVPCPACGRPHIVERLKAPPPAARPAAGAKSRRSTAARPAAAPARSPAPSPLRPGEFLCPCGAIQPPRTSRTGKEFTCSACGRKGHLDVETDPVTQEVTFVPVIDSGPAR